MALRNSHVFGEVLCRERGAGGDQVCWCAFEDDSASVVAGSRAEVDDSVGVGYHGEVVFDHYDGFA